MKYGVMGVFFLKNSKSFITFLRVSSVYYFLEFRSLLCRQLEVVFLQFTAASQYNYYTSYLPEPLIEKLVYILF